MEGAQVHELAVELRDSPREGAAKDHRSLGDRVEHGLNICRRFADDLKNIGCRCLLLQRRSELLGALLDFLFKTLRPLRIVERDGGLRGQHRHQVAVGVAETAERAVDVGVDKSEQPLLRDQRDDERRALVKFFGGFRLVAQNRGASTACFFDHGRNRAQQHRCVFASWQQRTGDAHTRGRLQHQQHALGAA